MAHSELKKKLRKRKELGASLIEYSILVSLVAIIAIVAVKSVGDATSLAFENTRNALAGSGGIPCTPTFFRPCT